MASSEDAVRNFVYDFHIRDLQRGWQIVQQLVAAELDSWERIHSAYPVKNLNEQRWDEADESLINKFAQTCPLLGHKLASQLAAQAALFAANHHQSQPLRRGNTLRLGSLGERINRLYFKERAPAVLSKTLASANKLRNKPKMIPFTEAVQHPGFMA